MQTPLAARVAAIRYPQVNIARAADLDKNTVTRALRGRSVLSNSLTKIDQAVTAEELRLRDLLLKRHPTDVRERTAA